MEALLMNAFLDAQKDDGNNIRSDKNVNKY